MFDKIWNSHSKHISTFCLCSPVVLGKSCLKVLKEPETLFICESSAAPDLIIFFLHWSCHWQSHCQENQLEIWWKKIFTSSPSIFLQDYFCLAFTSLVNADFKEGISLDNKGNDWTSSDRGMEVLINGSKESEQVLCLTGAKILTFCKKRNCNLHWCLQNSMF